MKTKKILFLVVLSLILNFKIFGQEIINLYTNDSIIEDVPQIHVFWQTVNERNFCTFYVERSENFNDIYYNVHTISGNIDTGDTSTYFFTDFGPFEKGNTYCYRLILDTQYVVTAECFFNRIHPDTSCMKYNYESVANSIDKNKNQTLTLFPNPTNSKVQIKGFNVINSIQIFDSYGKDISTIQISQLSNQMLLDLSKEAKGLYFINFYSEDELYHYKIIKQ
ncbi:MAG: T9SS type A sorting domain-containing protein [Flavobacteriia bacterium]|nr:T9SS type A sorting domain-containing protein [Flavobacteriia bacterium]